MATKFDFSAWIQDCTFPDVVVKVLAGEGFTTLPALLNAAEDDLKCLSLGRGHFVHLRASVKTLQEENGGGPLCSTPSDGSVLAGVDTLEGLLGKLNLGYHVPAAATTQAPKRGEALRIVDFVSAAMVAEEEVSLGGGISIRLNSRPKLEKVSPSAWIVANARILTTLRSRDPDFDVAAYTKYTEMVGELGCRFSWQSVLTFDDEYRQRQATEKFSWGTDAPHLATVVLRLNVEKMRCLWFV